MGFEALFDEFRKGININMNSFADFAFLLYLRSETASDKYYELYQLYLEANNKGKNDFSHVNKVKWENVIQMKNLLEKKPEAYKNLFRAELDRLIKTNEKKADEQLKSAASDNDVKKIQGLILKRKQNEKIKDMAFQNLHTGFQRQKVW